jgi:hypothetical protein
VVTLAAGFVVPLAPALGLPKNEEMSAFFDFFPPCSEAE